MAEVCELRATVYEQAVVEVVNKSLKPHAQDDKEALPISKPFMIYRLLQLKTHSATTTLLTTMQQQKLAW